MKIGKKTYIFGTLATLVIGFYLGNAAWLVPSHPEERLMLAHRGLHQTFETIGVGRSNCTAIIIAPPTHDYLENTLPSIQAAIDLGADIIEIDIHPTTDSDFMVFHDWELSCRTDGEGVVREQTKEYLKSLDIGFGYTADNGKTYPFRGKFVGKMPTLGEVLTAYPETHFLINIKGGDPKEASQLTEYLKNHPHTNSERISVYGNGTTVIDKFARLNPDMITLNRDQAFSCLKMYLLTGWSGHVPDVCSNTYVPVPKNYQWIIWGWPNRFEKRLNKVGSKPMLMGSRGQGASSGVDDRESIPANYGGVVWTNRIDIVGAQN